MSYTLLDHALRYGKSKLESAPEAYFTIMQQYMRLKYPDNRNQREKIPRKNTSLVIEGFPRSGNSFAVAAATYACGRSIHIGHHTHTVAAFYFAHKRKIPAICLFRDPWNAVASLIGLSEELRALGVDFPNYRICDMGQLFTSWEKFYRDACLSRGDVYFVSFERLGQDLSKTFKQIQIRYHIPFNPEIPEDVKIKEFMGWGQQKRGIHAMPSDERKKIVTRVKSQMSELMESNLKVASSYRAASVVFDDLVKKG